MMEMKTSTPTIVQQGKHSLNNDLLDMETDEDIEKEIQRKREEAINKSSEVRRKSTATALIAGLTGSELLQHCRECIKLSTENKINTKNAFSFLIIDAMAAMTKKADSEINKNFQVASCTLDASVKIYGYRVDAIHTEAVKMAGGILSKEVQNDEDKNENLDENETKTKSKKKKRKKLTVVQPETLNAKSETELIMDFVPHQSFLMHKSERSDLLIKIPKLDDNNILCINSDYNYWPSDDVLPSADSYKKSEGFDFGSLKPVMSEIELSKEDHFCSYYHNFEFGKNFEDMHDNSDNDELHSSDNSNRFEFDLNAPVEDIPMEDECEIIEVESTRNRLEVPLGGYDSDQEIKLLPTPEKKNFHNMQISDLKNRISSMPLEYSMFDEQVLKAWAGPSFWKVCPNKKRQMEDDKEDENVSKAIGSKRTRKGKIKSATSLFEVKDAVLEKHLACGEKTTLSKSTMLNWNPQNVTVPKDCKYKAKTIISLFHLPNFMSIMKKDESNQIEIIDISDSKSEQNEELEYCSNLSIGFEEIVQEDEEKKEENVAFDTRQIWNEQNMVAAPNRVEKMLVSTYKRKKTVDIKQLKNCLWNLITESETVQNVSDSEASSVTSTIAFSKVMNTYPSYVPNNLASNVNATQIFNALLHLANEKNLMLKQDCVNSGDFTISL